MFPEEFYNKSDNKDDSDIEREKNQLEKDAEFARELQGRLDLETGISDLNNKSKELLREHNDLREKFHYEKNIETKAELDKKCSDVKEQYSDVNNEIEELKDLYRSRYNSEPEYDTMFEEEPESSSDLDSSSSEEQEQNRPTKNYKSSHEYNKENVLLPIIISPISFYIKNFLNNIKPLFLAIRNAIPFFWLFISLSFIHIPEFLLVMYSDLILALKGPIFI
jgi:hypothetical protein